VEVLVVGVAAGRDVSSGRRSRVDAADASRALWDEHYPRLAGWCAAVVGDEAMAHDIAAEAFVRLLARWRAVEQPKPFLDATAMNLMRDHWRAQARQRSLVERIGVDPDAPPTEDWMGDLAAHLPERLRGPVLLHYGADLPVDEVAIALGRPAGTVKRQLAEGRALLRDMLLEGDEA
jgi:RNA polymerase sigma-70 factor (ECF subfamily)